MITLKFDNPNSIAIICPETNEVATLRPHVKEYTEEEFAILMASETFRALETAGVVTKLDGDMPVVATEVKTEKEPKDMTVKELRDYALNVRGINCEGMKKEEILSLIEE